MLMLERLKSVNSFIYFILLCQHLIFGFLLNICSFLPALRFVSVYYVVLYAEGFWCFTGVVGRE